MSIITTGYVIGNKSDSTGIQGVYMQAFNKNASITTATYGVISGGTGLTASGYFKEMEQETEDVTFNSNATISIENNNIFYESTLELRFTKFDQETNNLAKLLALGRYRIILKTNNDEYYLMGYETPAKVTAKTNTPGKGYSSDAFGTTLTFTAKSKNLIQKMDSTFAKSLIN